MASHHRIGRDKQGRNAVCNEIEETRKILIDLCVGKGANTEQHSVRTGADASPQLTPFTAFISESMSGPPSDSLVRYAGFSKSLGPIESAHYLRKGQYFSLSSSANADAAILGQNFLFLLKEATHQRSITWNGNGTGLYSPTTVIGDARAPSHLNQVSCVLPTNCPRVEVVAARRGSPNPKRHFQLIRSLLPPPKLGSPRSA